MLLAALAGLMAFGLAFVLSATQVNEFFSELAWYKQPFNKMIVFYTIGIGLAAVVCLKDYHQLARYAFIGYWGCIVLLLFVLIPGIGAERYGARRWFDLGIVQFQPSELAKIAFLLAMAQFLSRPRSELKNSDTLLKAIGLTALPFGLILFEPDLGSSIMLLPPALVMLYVAGAPAQFLKKLVGSVACFIAASLLYVFFVPQAWKPIQLPDYQKRRMMVYFGVDYQTQYAKPNATPAELRRVSAMQRRDSYEQIADIFNSLDRTTENRFMGALEERNQEGAEKIKNLMFTFEDLTRINPSGIQVLLRQLEKDQLALALKGGSDKIRNLFFKNMSERAARMMQEDMEAMGAVRIKEVEDAQNTVVNSAKTLADSGEIVIAGGREDDELVF